MNALNERLREDFTADVGKGIKRWNRVIADHGLDFQFVLPHPGFNRRIGVFAGVHVSPDGRILSGREWQERCGEWLPSSADKDYLLSLMSAPVHEPGRFAHWIAPPARGVDDKPPGFAYVRFEGDGP